MNSNTNNSVKSVQFEDPGSNFPVLAYSTEPFMKRHSNRQGRMKIDSVNDDLRDRHRNRLANSHSQQRAKNSREIYEKNLILLQKLSSIGTRKAFANQNDYNNVVYRKNLIKSQKSKIQREIQDNTDSIVEKSVKSQLNNYFGASINQSMIASQQSQRTPIGQLSNNISILQEEDQRQLNIEILKNSNREKNDSNQSPTGQERSRNNGPESYIVGEHQIDKNTKDNSVNQNTPEPKTQEEAEQIIQQQNEEIERNNYLLNQDLQQSKLNNLRNLRKKRRLNELQEELYWVKAVPEHKRIDTDLRHFSKLRQDRRKTENRKIHNENMAMFQRLINTKPTTSYQEWQDDHKRKHSYFSRIIQKPMAISHNPSQQRTQKNIKITQRDVQDDMMRLSQYNMHTDFIKSFRHSDMCSTAPLHHIHGEDDDDKDSEYSSKSQFDRGKNLKQLIQKYMLNEENKNEISYVKLQKEVNLSELEKSEYTRQMRMLRPLKQRNKVIIDRLRKDIQRPRYQSFGHN